MIIFSSGIQRFLMILLKDVMSSLSLENRYLKIFRIFLILELSKYGLSDQLSHQIIFYWSMLNRIRPTTIAKSEIREFGFFRNHECRKTLSTTIGNPLIRFGKSGTRSWSAREVGSTILVGTWNENPDITAYSGFFVFSDRHKSELPKKKLPNIDS